MKIHATCVDYRGVGILIIGPSGSGKSDLALRLIMDKGAELVADDYTEVELRSDNAISASCPAGIVGLLEVRGIGLCPFQSKPESRVALMVELCGLEEIERLPENEFFTLLDGNIPKIKLNAFEASSVNKVILACNKYKFI